ncbi:MAG TPA: MFS transporter, partial [Thermomicrobiales bacterium]|nr:MFS transporter [Thermomicrobiales bacterium]
IQGIGGGGLMAIAFAVIGDVIPARERGRYQGYFGAVFGISSIAGPLLGGWITDTISWRWIFYINIPLGIFALIITSLALRMPVVRRDHRIDYLGASVIVAAVTSFLLYLNWAGEHYGWSDLRALAFVIAAVVLAVGFIFIELRAEEPIIPMRLFRNPIFTVGNLFTFLIGFAMFAGAVYLPLFFQGVMGMSPTQSGLALLPMVAGMFSMSITSGLLITRTGKYKIFPIIGCVILIVAMFMLSSIEWNTPYWQIAISAFCFGVGLGLAMMTIVTPVQNSVDFRDMGVATSTITFLRSLGGAIGVALFGAIMNARLGQYLADALGDQLTAMSGGEINTNNVQSIQDLPEPIKTEVLSAYTHAITDIYLLSIPIIVVALVVVLFLKEIPLRTRMAAAVPSQEGAGEAPRESDAGVPAYSGH